MKECNNQGLVSVLIPAYKVENYLDRCLTSVVEQSYNNIEIILVLQPSPDKTELIANQWAERDGRIRIIYQERPSVAQARNTLIKNANGKFCCFVDSDDIIYRDHISILLGVLTESDADIVQGQIYAFKDDRYIPEFDYSKGKYEVLSGPSYTKKMLYNVYGATGGVVQGKLQKTSVFDKVEFPEGRNAEDTATIYKYSYSASKVVVYNAPTYFYQSSRGESLTHSVESRRTFDWDGLLAYNEMIDFFINGDVDIYDQCLYLVCNRIAMLKHYMKENIGRELHIASLDSFGNICDKNFEKKMDIVNNHVDYVRKVKCSNISIAKKIIVYLGYINPTLWMKLWRTKGRIRLYFEWKNKK